jgi:hypothetical protein
LADPMIRYLMQKRAADTGFSREDAEEVMRNPFDLERSGTGSDAEIARSAWLPGADRPRSQRPPQSDPDRYFSQEDFEDLEIFNDALSDRPLTEAPVLGRRSSKE